MASSSELSSAPSSPTDPTSITSPETNILVDSADQVDASVLSSSRKRKADVHTKSSKRVKKIAIADSVGVDSQPTGQDNAAKPIRKPRGRRAGKETKHIEHTTEVNAQVEEEDGADGEVKVKAKVTRKRKTKEEKEREALPLAERTVGSKLLVGAHVSAAGGVHRAVTNCVRIGANAFALFLKSQRKWENPPLDPDHLALFKAACTDHSISPGSVAVPHGSYLVNLAHPDPDRSKQAYNSFHDDLTRCHKLGIKLYNFHPGNSASTTREDGIAHIAQHLNNAHSDPDTGAVITLLETMASLGNTVGGTFEDLADIIALVDDQSRVGVCLDTCHIFAAGYDLRTSEALTETLDKFDQVIGLNYLKALHVNDSKAPLSSHRDLHSRIGEGYLGLRAFHALVNEPRLWGLPMVLETPIEIVGEDGKKTDDHGVWAREIKMLENMVGMDVESDEFKAMEKELSEKGKAERDRVMDQVLRRIAKDEKDKTSRKGRGRKKAESEEESD